MLLCVCDVESSPISIPIEQTTLLRVSPSEDSGDKVEWKVEGCGYSWNAQTTFHDVRYLHEVVFKTEAKPSGMEQDVPVDGSDEDILNELAEVLSQYKCLLVLSPVDYILKKEYYNFQS